MTDEKSLIRRCKNHDFEAFGELVKMYENMVYNLAFRLLNNAEDAEDVLQETFLNAYRALDKFRFEAKFSTWLYRIAYNLSLAKMKHRQTSQFYLDMQDGIFDKIQANNRHYSSRTPEDAFMNKEVSLVLEKAILEIPQQNRAVFILRDVEGYTTQEVADITSLSISAVKSRLHRARLALRSLLINTFKPRVPYLKQFPVQSLSATTAT